MQRFVKKPGIDMYPGICVNKDTVLEYENENVKQSLRDLVFKSKTRVTGENYESIYHTTICLNEGDILIFEEEGRGYIKPVEEFVTIREAVEDFENIRNLDGEQVQI